MFKKYLGAAKRNWPLLVIMIFFAVAYSSYSLLRHMHFGSSGFDLGIFDQAIWHYSRLEVPASTTRGVSNLLGDHFHPILIILAPLYWISSSVNMLLIVQGCLFALAILPIWLFVKKRLGKIPAYCFVLAYATFWGTLNAVAFDFHEIAFAVPIIAFMIYFIEEKKWRHYFIALALLLLVKEDMSILVAFFGIYLLAKKELKRGAISLVAGVTWFFLATKLFIPFFAGASGAYAYWTYTQLGPDPISSIVAIIKNPMLLYTTMVNPKTKTQTAKAIFYPFFLLPFFSPLIILAVPLISERFLSTNMIYWVKDFHYTATIAPILAMAGADGLYNITKLVNHKKLRTAVIMGMSVFVLLMNLKDVRKSQQWSLTSPDFYSLSSNDKTGKEALNKIPKDASVMSQDVLIPHLSHRNEIYQLKPGGKLGEYIVATKTLGVWPNNSYTEVETILNDAKKNTYKTVFEKNEWVVLRRN